MLRGIFVFLGKFGRFMVIFWLLMVQLFVGIIILLFEIIFYVKLCGFLFFNVVILYIWIWVMIFFVFMIILLVVLIGVI